MTNQLVTQAVLVDQTDLNPKSIPLQLALFDDTGAPVVATDLASTNLTGYTVGANTAVSSSDTMLTAIEKLQGQINARQATHQANTTAADLTALKADFDTLLGKLQAAGLMA